MTLRTPLIALALLVSTVCSSVAFGHAHLLDPAPRTPINNGGLKTGPCGGIAAQTTFTEMVIGSAYTITWRETIEHPGSFRLALSTNGEAAFDSYVVVASAMDMAGPAPHEYAAAITIPDTANCNPCVLQLRQYMLAASPYYYSCADVKFVTELSAPTPTPTPTATPTATPGGNGGDDSVSGTALCSVTSLGSLRVGTALVALGTLALGLLLARRRR